MSLTLQQLTSIESILGNGRVQKNKNISPYLTMRTQVEASYYIEVNTREEWIQLFPLLKESDFPYFILGGGSNIAILSEELDGLVIRNMYQKKEVVNDTPEYSDMLVSSGYIVTRLAKETADMGLSGFEYQLGLPGTLGGGIYMNSKWTRPDSYLGDHLISAVLIDREGKVKEVDQDYFNFSYGYSILQETKEFFLEGTFRMQKIDPEELNRRATEALDHRNKTQPKGKPTTGCFFKNISEEEQKAHDLPTKSTGYLIDKAGMKGKSVGEYYISDMHANFIMNRGNGNPQDLRTLVDQVKAKVKEVYGIDLREEVIIM